MNTVFPILIALLLIYAALRGVDPYSAFIEGAKEAVPTALGVLPNLAAMLAAIAVFRACGGVDLLAQLFSPVLSVIGIPSELASLIILRPLSGSASLALLSDILNNYGTDSFIGICASVCVGSTETILYTIALYCGSVGIKKTRYALPVALISGLVGVITAIAFVRLLVFQ